MAHAADVALLLCAAPGVAHVPRLLRTLGSCAATLSASLCYDGSESSILLIRPNPWLGTIRLIRSIRCLKIIPIYVVNAKFKV